ncbi:type I-E CRISPR-associated protein Cas6/Cse3/CasE [Dermatophilus congolensis]|uniref:CRISPR-associated protein Cas6/Cse3/CasE, subtype I-E/ECOLI n=1 Tax=Dermatophilus congolensis TaxID=1863 RepID=A0A239VJ31_9MICO|nr:type I-E CRISPR-associated protein Cas6/Cse3/CasE [Dermatophilus congolensis]MBO3129039.1 type I-E CRISPR-associated protein Cas6/Cse3/CasE [Dermatophilus congolensis]MBO3132324.1 type I-E CRISPR-associated protein Cas6/Cse3/CasE [Dermatophilus congolensis]MBO3133515.1 type I-E CRISPR-associated protein Cas6/Cse3/CasE [Dermatophilus congolensis]MBO3135749.1 type I-E CRISPR-associated protein Cas6/Cse3/CasE [Dermatophilus congolensis]MBO3137988.1 type I-E CRISPR-associated protein Cas6/Cse3/
MFLTRFGINTSRRGARHLLSAQQRMHAAVLAGFPSETPGRVLWRVDSSPTKTDLFIVSPKRPDLTHLVEQAGWPTTATWDTADYTPFLERLEEGQKWAFRLTANPVRNINAGPNERGKVKAHVTPAQQQEWLMRRAGKCGFSIAQTETRDPNLVVKNRNAARFERRHAQQGRNVTIAMATYDGLLHVTDPDALRAALTEGIGRAKAYGCGLMTLAKA